MGNELSVFLGKCLLEVFHQILMKVSCPKTKQIKFGGREEEKNLNEVMKVNHPAK